MEGKILTRTASSIAMDDYLTRPKTPQFITVKYGDNKKLVLNPWCRCKVLLEHLHTAAECADGVIVDLVDPDGRVKHLSSKPNEYASEQVRSRGTFILIRVEKQEGEALPDKYHPLLSRTILDEQYPDLRGQLANLSRSQTPLSSSMSKRLRRMGTVSKIKVMSKEVGKEKRSKKAR
ncbi:unnamed protein product [Owenia fusiformis]|uniref:Uncharacterized protein n=1 Tax=Owenia fusiformis TaxID=6347 RepID=A0A8S4Q5Z9_OWEFU|nr:unnamed protein product [Owenia fusiformis]